MASQAGSRNRPFGVTSHHSRTDLTRRQTCDPGDTLAPTTVTALPAQASNGSGLDGDRPKPQFV